MTTKRSSEGFVEVAHHNSFHVKDQLKRLGGYWDPKRRAWMLPPENAKDALFLCENFENGEDPQDDDWSDAYPHIHRDY